MALVKYGALAQDVRGSQNGLTFSRNKGGAYVRQKVSPVQPNTPEQRAVRQRFALNSKLWSGTMTPAERDAWNAYAVTYPYSNVFGDSSVLTGLAMSMAKNQVLNQIGVASITTPPPDNSVTALPIPDSMDATALGGIFEIGTPAQVAQPLTKYYVFATPAQPQGRNPSESVYRFIGAYAAVAAATMIGAGTALADDYQARFGNLESGTIIWAIVSQVDVASGNITVGTKLSAIVT